MYTFKFVGGSRQITPHESEQFRLFGVVNGVEIPHYTMLKSGLLTRGTERDEYVSSFKEWKIFTHHSGFGIPTRFFSFYIQLREMPNARVTLLSLTQWSQWHFSGIYRFLSKKEALALLIPTEQSYGFLERSEPVPEYIIRSLIHVDKTELRKGVRQLRF